ALAYAKGGETDGKVHDYDLEVIAVGLNRVPQRVAALVREGAWQEIDRGWFIAGWCNWNEDTRTLRERKKARADGAAKTNHQKHVAKGIEFIGSCQVCTGEVEAA